MVTPIQERAPTGPEASRSTSAARAEHWSGPVHWTHFRARQRQAGTPTLVFVHGAGHNEQVWTLGPENWVNHFTRLGYDCLTLSLRGHRPSKGRVTFQTMQHYLADLYAPIQALGLAEAQVVYLGHSMGGILVQLLLAQHPRLAGVVVVDSVAPWRAARTYGPILRQVGRRHPLVLLASLFNPAAMFSSDTLVRELLVGPEVSAEVVRALRRTLGGETSLALLEMRRLQRQGLLPLPGEKLLFLGAQESFFFPPSAQEASAREQGATFVQVPGTHNLMLTSAALQAAKAIQNFLARLPCAEDALPNLSLEDQVTCMRRFYAALNAGNLDSMLALVAPDFIEHVGEAERGTPAIGQEAFRQARLHTRQTLTDIQVTLCAAQPVGPETLLVHAQIAATEREGGRLIQRNAVSLVRFRSGLLAEHWEYQFEAATVPTVPTPISA